MINAAKTNSITELKKLIDTGANINSTDEHGMTALMWAAYHGHLEIVQRLVTAGAKLEAKDNDGWTALMLAADRGHLKTVQRLVTAGAELNAARPDGQTALMWAAYQGHVAVAQYLVYSGKPWFRSILPLQNYDAAIAELEQYSRRARYASKTGVSLTGIRDNIASLKAMLLGGGGAEPAPAAVKYPRRINLLAAKICGVVFPEEFTQNLSGMSMSKFIAVSSLMRSAKLAKLVHGLNEYLSVRILMQAKVDNIMLSKLHEALMSNILSFIVGKENTALTMQEMPYTVLAASIAPDPAPASLAAAYPNPRQAASDSKTVINVSP
jgi:hypothetical protein